MADRVIEELDEAESLRLISAGGIGRIAYQSRFGPAVLLGIGGPINCVIAATIGVAQIEALRARSEAVIRKEFERLSREVSPAETGPRARRAT